MLHNEWQVKPDRIDYLLPVYKDIMAYAQVTNLIIYGHDRVFQVSYYISKGVGKSEPVCNRY